MTRRCVQCGYPVRLGHGRWIYSIPGIALLVHKKAAECTQPRVKLTDAPQGNVAAGKA